ncbi:MAG: NYN domain-containing protein [Trichlorobacter sp.]|nr:NYN domain-containing protein [Trichlorobacter sp.]
MFSSRQINILSSIFTAKIFRELSCLNFSLLKELLYESKLGKGSINSNMKLGSFFEQVFKSLSASWKKVLQKFAIKPVQQFAYTTGKNATDSTLIIDAMDLLYTRKFDGFCLITSDSDFTGLAMRLREEGLTVLGFGEKKTPEAFRNACHKFLFTEVLRPSATNEPTAQPQKAENDQKALQPQSSAETAEVKQEFPKKFVLAALEQSSDDAGWAHLGTFGSYLTKLQPDFDSRIYGYKKLSDLVKAKTELFITEERQAPGSTQKVLYLRAK